MKPLNRGYSEAIYYYKYSCLSIIERLSSTINFYKLILYDGINFVAYSSRSWSWESNFPIVYKLYIMSTNSNFLYKIIDVSIIFMCRKGDVSLNEFIARMENQLKTLVEAVLQVTIIYIQPLQWFSYNGRISVWVWLYILFYLYTHTYSWLQGSTDDPQKHSFPTMGSFRRKIIHDLCYPYGCTSKSHGDEPNRIITVSAQKWDQLLEYIIVIEECTSTLKCSVGLERMAGHT